MASSSTSSLDKSFKYDVFLSFRGEDTRTDFIDHLYHALQNKSIHTYKDDEKIKKGKNISDELVKIMEWQRTNEHTAYPVFYDVEPSEVRKQSGLVAEAFAKHEKEEAAGKWREALKESADLCGWELKKTADGHEAKVIQRIVEEISLELRSISFNIDEKLVGMETRIEDLVPSLGIGCDDVRMIGIKGMGGGGKTTLARAVFDHISFRFEGKSFVENVRESASLSGLKSLQKQVLSDVLNDKDINISSVYDGKHMMKRRLRDKKVIVVLDDVDHINQLEALVGEPNWFKHGSKIIITTRDEQVLVAHGVKFIHDVNLLSDMEATCLFNRFAFGRDIPIQGYEELSRQVVHYAAGLPLTIRVLGSFLCGKDELEWIDALERLRTIPETETLKKLELSYLSLEEDYKEIFLDVACILIGWQKDKAIKALESCGFHARNGLRVLEQKSLITIHYDHLGMHDHIVEMGRNIVRRSHPDKPHKHSRLWKIDEIEEILVDDLGTEAIRCIQFHTFIFNPHIFRKGLRKVKELRFLSVRGNCSIDLEFNIAGPDFPNALRYLEWSGYPFRSLPTTFQANNLVALEMDGSKRKVLKRLRFLNLSFSRLSTFDLGLTPNLETLTLQNCDDLLELHMTAGCLKLTSINLKGSIRLRTLDLGLAPSIEELILVEFNDLEKLNLPGRCLNLRRLLLTNSRLRILDIGLTPNLEKLHLQKSYCLEELHMANECQKLTELIITHSNLRTLDLGMTPNLKKLVLTENRKLVELHTAIGCLKHLVHIDLSGCLRFISFLFRIEDYTSCSVDESLEVGPLAELHLMAESLESCPLHPESSLPKFRFRCYYEDHRPSLTRNLEMLISVGMCACTNLETFSRSICGLRRLRKLKLEGCFMEVPKALDHLESLEELILLSTNLEELIHVEYNNLEKLKFPRRCLNLRRLLLTNSNLRTLDIGLTPNIEKLHLQKSYCLEELHMANECQRLTELIITHSNLRTLDLGMTRNLKKLVLTECRKLVELHTAIGCLKKLVHVDLSGCLRFISFLFRIEDYTSCSVDESLEVGPLAELHLMAESLESCPLHPESNLPKFRFRCYYEDDRPSLTRNLEMLISVGMCACTNLETFSRSICGLRRLRKLKLEGCFLEVPKVLDQLESLEELILLSTKINHLPDSICKLKHLKCLRLNDLRFLERLPEDIGHLEWLEELSLLFTNIKHLPDSIYMCKHLKSLKLRLCLLLEKLPENLGRLKHLEELALSCTNIKYLPDSICMLKHLKYLELYHCSLLEKLPDNLGRLEHLEELHLSKAEIKHLPGSICMLKSLKYLKIYDCSLHEKLPEDLGRLGCLEELDLSFTNIEHLPDSICMLKRLKYLKLYHCSLLEKLPEDLGQLERLEVLSLGKCELLKNIPNSICELKCLTCLHLRDCIRVEKLPEELERLECLEELDIKGTSISHLPQSILLLKGLLIIGFTPTP